MSALSAIFRRELTLRLRGGGWAASAALFVVAAGMAPLSFGREAELLAAAAPAILWLTASLALLIGLDGLFEEDLRSGGLLLYRLSDVPLSAIALIKMIAAWATACLPLVAVAPLLLFAFGVESIVGGTIGFLVGTPALAFITGAIGAVSAGLRRGTALLVFLCLPLFAPVLVFGPASAGEASGVPLLMLGAFSLQGLAVCPFIAAAALRANMA